MIFDTRPSDWKDLQDFVKQMFDECGFETESPHIVELVRGKKEVDVYAKDLESEYQPVVFIECKFWNSPIPQDTIHSFRTVMADGGANLGFIVSKIGFQKGAYEAVEKTNIRLVTFEELEQVYYRRWLKNIPKRYMEIADKLFPYWDPSGGKRPADGGKISYETERLLYQAYKPLCSIGPWDLDDKNYMQRKLPMTIPVVNNELIQTGSKIINTYREYFEECEDTKDKALKHFKQLYREE